MGPKVAKALQEVLKADLTGMTALLDAIGSPEGEAHSDELVSKAQAALADVLQIAIPGKDQTL